MSSASKLRIDGVKSWLNDNPWVPWAFLSAFVFLFAMSIELDKDASPLLHAIFYCTKRLGVLAVIMVPSFRALILGGMPPLSDYVVGFAVLTGVCAVLAQLGDTVITWATADALSATAVAVSLILVRVTLGLARSPWRNSALERSFESIGLPAAGYYVKAKPRTKLSSNDIRSTSAHEAGHTLPHAALAALPAHFVAVVELDHETGSLGYVTGVDDGDHLEVRRTFVEWQMLMLLGGRVAQRVLLGSETLGGTSDYSKWLTLANVYLSNGIKGLFYDEPKGADQVMLNKVALDNLQREQEALLAEFFENNLDVLSDLTDALVEHRRLDAEALEPFMARVRMPDGFPRPKRPTEPLN